MAKERVNAVCLFFLLNEGPVVSYQHIQARTARADCFNRGGIHLSQFLTDRLVGDGRGSTNPPHLLLKAGDWAFIYWNKKVYVGKGTVAHFTSLMILIINSASFNVLLQGHRCRESTCLAGIHICNYHPVLPGHSSFRRNYYHAEPVPVHPL